MLQSLLRFAEVAPWALAGQASLLVTRNKRSILFLSEQPLAPYSHLPPIYLPLSLSAQSHPLSMLNILFKAIRSCDCNFMANASRHFNCDLCQTEKERRRKSDRERERERHPVISGNTSKFPRQLRHRVVHAAIVESSPIAVEY